MKIEKKLLCVLLFVLAFVSPVYAFTGSAHVVILQIALDQLSESKKNYVLETLNVLSKTGCQINGIATAAWMDDLRQIKFWNTYHFNTHNIYNPQNIDLSNYQFSTQDISTVLPSAMSNIVNDFNDLSMFQKSYLLRLVVHLMGDLHQPFHNIEPFYKVYSTSGNTRGANTIKIVGQGVSIKSSNLHSLWDQAGTLFANTKYSSSKDFSSCPKSALYYISEIQGFVDSGDAKKIATQLLKKYNTHDVDLDIDIKTITQKMSKIAINTGLRPLEAQLFALENPEKPIRINDQYLENISNVLSKNIVIAGLRLGKFLDKTITVPKNKLLVKEVTLWQKILKFIGIV